MFNRKYIFKGSIFHCYVSLPEGSSLKRQAETPQACKFISVNHSVLSYPRCSMFMYGLFTNRLGEKRAYEQGERYVNTPKMIDLIDLLGLEKHVHNLTC